VTGTSQKYLVFTEGHRVPAGSLAEAAVVAKRLKINPRQKVTVVDFVSGEPVEVNVRGSFAEVSARYSKPPTKGRGRPKLGVAAREVTLMPLHWEWLARQPGGASAALRQLVDAARANKGPKGRSQSARDAAYHMLSTLAESRAGLDKAVGALLRGDEAGLMDTMNGWPPDIRLSVLERLRADIGEDA
jgi:hypothetical protein